MAIIHIAYISIGSNMGRRRFNCREGIRAIEALPSTLVVDRSPLYKTQPVDFTDQEWFANAVVKAATGLEPHDLLDSLQVIQRGAGRVKDSVRFGPRLLDLDILLYDDRILHTPELEIPHPRMHKRRFVLQPICDINPDIIHPLLNISLKSLLNQLDDNEQVVFEM